LRGSTARASLSDTLAGDLRLSMWRLTPSHCCTCHAALSDDMSRFDVRRAPCQRPYIPEAPASQQSPTPVLQSERSVGAGHCLKTHRFLRQRPMFGLYYIDYALP
jgi:hypothetical protein